ncbi:MAG TPA: SDR family oxidoreductase [Devosia sp.]|nr:SDR family oxidoreductase [Devosia sp.]
MRIAIIGAGGFVGGWVAEELAGGSSHEPLAYVRRWSSAQRVARRGIALRLADTTMDFAGIDAIVNASLPLADEPMVLRDLYGRAAKAGVRRFVHLSSAAVYGDLEGALDETIAPRPNDDYARGKRAGELELLRLAGAGGPEAVILRPSIIYGPFSEPWTIRYAKRITAGKWLGLGAAGDGTCNLIHARDVVRAVVAAIEAPTLSGPLVLNINGPDLPSWNDYIRLFGDALGTEGRRTPSAASLAVATSSARLTRTAGRLVKKYAGGLLAAVTASSAGAKSMVQGAKGIANLYPDEGELRLLRRRAVYDGTLAADAIGYRPAVSLAAGLQESVAWLRRHGIV